MTEVAAEHARSLPPLQDDTRLIDLGLDSLGLAVIVARLEDGLGVDPFRASIDAPFPVTVGDFIRIYENAAR
ncbi:MAG: acyl carrier protein [Acidisphaera sp.]|nr:acyl carrier protein [Acidisphaera sp.]MBV9813399.1 acyl carrier protein [Acetobacteraceae bacterium]